MGRGRDRLGDEALHRDGVDACVTSWYWGINMITVDTYGVNVGGTHYLMDNIPSDSSRCPVQSGVGHTGTQTFEACGSPDIVKSLG